MKFKARLAPSRAEHAVYDHPLSHKVSLQNVLFHWLRRDGLALVVFTLGALWTIYPIVPHIRSRIMGGLGDNVQYVYMTGWMGQSLLLGKSPFVDPRPNYPDTLALMVTDAPYLNMIVAAPITWLLGPIFTYNLIILFSAFLSGYLCYLWICQLTGSRAGGLIAGLAFLLTPFRLIHSFGHPQIASTYVLPLFFWTLALTLRPTKPTLRGLLLLTSATLLAGSASQYLLIICLVSGAIYTLLTVLPRWCYLLREGWKIALSVGGGATLGAIPYLMNASKQAYQPYILDDVRLWAANPGDFFLPSRLHPLWGNVIQRLQPDPLFGEKTLYIGLVTGLLALVALMWQHSSYRRQNWVWLGVALGAAGFALGTDLHINNQPVQESHPVWLPAYYLSHLPFLSFMRIWPRFGIVTILFVALLAGMGTVQLIRRLPQWRWPILAIVGALLLIDLLPGRLPSSLLEPRPIDRWLAQQPGDFAVAFLPPISPGEDVANYQALYGSLFHAKHLPGFNHPFHLTRAYRDFREKATHFPAEASIQALRAMNFRYLLLEQKRFNGVSAPRWDVVQSAISKSPDVHAITMLDGIEVVEFR